MKYTFTLLTALLLLTGQVNTAQAQRQDNPTMTNKYFKLDFSGGINGNIAPVKRENSALLGSRPDVVPAFAFRASHLFSKQIGWYAGLRVDLYEEKRTESYKTGFFGQFIEDFFSELFEPIPSIYPASKEASFIVSKPAVGASSQVSAWAMPVTSGNATLVGQPRMTRDAKLRYHIDKKQILLKLILA